VVEVSAASAPGEGGSRIGTVHGVIIRVLPSSTRADAPPPARHRRNAPTRLGVLVACDARGRVPKRRGLAPPNLAPYEMRKGTCQAARSRGYDLAVRSGRESLHDISRSSMGGDRGLRDGGGYGALVLGGGFDLQ
jgi:hypothetical protein